MSWMRDGGVLQRVWQRLPAKEESRTPNACIVSIGKLAISQEQHKSI
jgi:hypothetical protein